MRVLDADSATSCDTGRATGDNVSIRYLPGTSPLPIGTPMNEAENQKAVPSGRTTDSSVDVPIEGIGGAPSVLASR